jgi:hypothetical protein
MKLLNTKLALSVLGVALLATPALAQRTRHQASQEQMQYQEPLYNTVQPGQTPAYPNGTIRSGSAASVQSGAQFNVSY